MKTPRELLLERHAEATPQLDAIRQQVVADLSARPHTITARPFGARIKMLWRELIGPARVAWGSLAAAWALIALLNLARPQPMSAADPVAARSPMPGEALRIVLAEQRQLRAELLGVDFSETTQTGPQGTPSGATRPRSARIVGIRNT